MVENNLFISLFKYRPRANRNPLEDFTTECLGYLFQRDENLLHRYLDEITGNTTPKENFRVYTQHHVPSVGRIDLAVFWTENQVGKSLFVEHKVFSPVGGYEDTNGNWITQIDTYCQHQEGIDPEHNKVLLITKFPVRGFFKSEIRWKCYIDNKTWKEILNFLFRYQSNRKNNIDLNKQLLEEFLYFMRRNQMVGFENVTLAELSSIGSYENYSAKLANLTHSIMEKFNGIEESVKELDVKRYDLWGYDNIGYHYGIVFHDTDSTASESGFWIFLGLSTKSPLINDPWYPELTLSDEKIPDVECMILMGFDNDEEVKKFYDEMKNMKFEEWNTDAGMNFEVINPGLSCLCVVRRKPLVHFVEYEDQENAVLNFLSESYKLFSKPDSVLYQIMKRYREME